jgi:hypothetical protein
MAQSACAVRYSGSAGQVRRPLRVLLRIQIIQDQRDEFAAALRNGTSEATKLIFWQSM